MLSRWSKADEEVEIIRKTPEFAICWSDHFDGGRLSGQWAGRLFSLFSSSFFEASASILPLFLLICTPSPIFFCHHSHLFFCKHQARQKEPVPIRGGGKKSLSFFHCNEIFFSQNLVRIVVWWFFLGHDWSINLGVIWGQCMLSQCGDICTYPNCLCQLLLIISFQLKLLLSILFPAVGGAPLCQGSDLVPVQGSRSLNKESEDATSSQLSTRPLHCKPNIQTTSCCQCPSGRMGRVKMFETNPFEVFS